MTDDSEDWWQGTLVSDPSKSGQFPKNFVEASDGSAAIGAPTTRDVRAAIAKAYHGPGFDARRAWREFPWAFEADERVTAA